MPWGYIDFTHTVYHTAVNVGMSSAQVLASNHLRKAVLFINDSDSVIYLALGTNAVANMGVRINPDGGSYELLPITSNIYKGNVYAISSGASKRLLVTEFI